MKELEVIDRLRAAFPSSGIGDDAAVLPAAEGDLLFAADAAIEGVHFDLRFSTLSQAIQKLVTSNISDIFAMGGSPGSIVFTAGLRDGCAPRDVEGIIDGLRRACAQYNVALAGGDTVLSPECFVFNIAIMGTVRPGRAVPRSGARPGDVIVLCGGIGGSHAGLGMLSAIFGDTRVGMVPAPRELAGLESAAEIRKTLRALSLATSDPELDRLALAFGERPFARVMMRFARQHLVPLAHPLDSSLLDAELPCVTAMIDVSDGLAKDLKTLCAESGVGATVREDALPIPGGVREIFGLEGGALVDFALSSGEEYVLLATVPPEAAKRLPEGAAAIGTVVPAADGVGLIDGTGRARRMPELGYEHAF